jgi:hypothetical protein
MTKNNNFVGKAMKNQRTLAWYTALILSLKQLSYDILYLFSSVIRNSERKKIKIRMLHEVT